MNKVDVIICVYNGERFIGEAIRSVLQQTWKNFRLIVVDDGSTDHTAAKVRQIQKEDSRVALLQPGRLGLPKAINTGLDYSTAPFFGFLDADDLWEPRKLEKQVKLLLAKEDLLACFTQMKEFETFENPKAPQPFRARKEVINGISKLSFLGRRKILEILGYFDEEISTGDFINWFRPIMREGKYEVIPEVLVYRRIHDNNLTRNINPKDYLKILKAHLDAKTRNGG